MAQDTAERRELHRAYGYAIRNFMRTLIRRPIHGTKVLVVALQFAWAANHVHKKRYKRAIPALDKVLRKTGGGRTRVYLIHEFKARCYENLGEKEKAKKERKLAAKSQERNACTGSCNVR